MTYYDARWDHVRTKRERVQAFLNDPTRETFRELLDRLWAMEPRRSIEYYLDDIVFDDQTPEEVATAIERAKDDTNALQDVLDLDGFGWATATEILHALAPETYAILNKRSVEGMKALGYMPPSRQTASIEEYWSFVRDIEEVIDEYPLRELQAQEQTVPDVPEWASDFEAADAAFNAHFDDDAEFDLADAREARTRRIELPTELYGEITELVAENPMYRDEQDFIYSAIRREIDHATE